MGEGGLNQRVRQEGGYKKVGILCLCTKLTPLRGGDWGTGGLDGITGGCFNKHDGLSSQATDHPPMCFVHSTMVRRPVGQSVLFIEPASLRGQVPPPTGHI